MESTRRAKLVREWIIFALCLGLGGHIVLGLVLHFPDGWPGADAAVQGLLIGLAVYVVVQVIRSLWWVVKGRSRAGETAADEDADEI
jgi:hypothetical protein